MWKENTDFGNYKVFDYLVGGEPALRLVASKTPYDSEYPHDQWALLWTEKAGEKMEVVFRFDKDKPFEEVKALSLLFL